MEIRCKECGKLFAKLKKAKDCELEYKCSKCGLKTIYSFKNI